MGLSTLPWDGIESVCPGLCCAAFFLTASTITLSGESWLIAKAEISYCLAQSNSKVTSARLASCSGVVAMKLERKLEMNYGF